MEDLKKNDIYTVTIEDYSSDASGICRINGRVANMMVEEFGCGRGVGDQNRQGQA